jgi:hypothetical protein
MVVSEEHIHLGIASGQLLGHVQHGDLRKVRPFYLQGGKGRTDLVDGT